MMRTDLHLDLPDPPIKYDVHIAPGELPFATVTIGNDGLGEVNIYSATPAALEHLAKVAKKAARELAVARVLMHVYERSAVSVTAAGYDGEAA